MVSGVLEHAMDILEHHSVACARKLRKSVRALLERTEGAAEVVDEAWCDGISDCSRVELDVLASVVVAVQGLSIEASDVSESLARVSGVLECLERCGSAVMQSVSVLQNELCDEDTRSRVLAALGGLSQARLEAPLEPEVAAFHACKLRWDGELSPAELILCAMAMFTLTCRNGLAVGHHPEVIARGVEHICKYTALLAHSCEPEDVRLVAAVFQVYGHHKHVSIQAIRLESWINQAPECLAYRLTDCDDYRTQRRKLHLSYAARQSRRALAIPIAAAATTAVDPAPRPLSQTPPELIPAAASVAISTLRSTSCDQIQMR